MTTVFNNSSKRLAFILLVFLNIGCNSKPDFEALNAEYLNIPYADEAGIVTNVYQPWITGVRWPQNGGIIRHGSEWLIAFRTNIAKDPIVGLTTNIGIAKLTDDFILKGKPTILSTGSDYVEDPRLIKYHNDLVIVANTRANKKSSTRSMCLIGVDEANVENGQYGIKYHTVLDIGQNEKNWAPFVFNDKLHLSYNIVPEHDVWRIDDPSDAATLTRSVYLAHSITDWGFGEIRGGTPAELIDKNGTEYLGFFHSVYKLRGNVIYFAGAYTFEAMPPFKITKVSKWPLVIRDMYSAGHNLISLPQDNLLVAFPTGLAIEGDKVFLSVGINDSEIKILALDKQKLLESLRPVGSQ